MDGDNGGHSQNVQRIADQVSRYDNEYATVPHLLTVDHSVLVKHKKNSLVRRSRAKVGYFKYCPLSLVLISIIDGIM